MIVDYAIYVDGQRAVETTSLEETYEAHRQRGGVAWIDLYRPDEEEFSSLAEEFGLPPLAVGDAIDAHQRPQARTLWQDALHRLEACLLPGRV